MILLRDTREDLGHLILISQTKEIDHQHHVYHVYLCDDITRGEMK